jgi:hypothetical protein
MLEENKAQNIGYTKYITIESINRTLSTITIKISIDQLFDQDKEENEDMSSVHSRIPSGELIALTTIPLNESEYSSISLSWIQSNKVHL